MWNNNLQVLQTFCSHHSQNAWVLFPGLGWCKIKPNATDGVTNMFSQFNAARSSGRLVSAFIDAVNEITIAYLL